MDGNARKRKRREAGPGGGSSSSTDEGNTDVKISMSAQSAAALLMGIAAAPARTTSRGNSPEQSRSGRPGNHAVAAASDRPVQARRLKREAEEEEPDAETLHSPSPNQPTAASPTRSDSGSTQSESEEHNPARRVPSLTTLTNTSSQLEQVAEQLQDPTQQRGQGRAQLQQQRRDQQSSASGHASPAAQNQYQMAQAYGGPPAMYHHQQQQQHAAGMARGAQQVYGYPGMPHGAQGMVYGYPGMVYPSDGRGHANFAAMQQAQMSQAYGVPPVRQVTAPKACICCARTNTPLWRDIGAGRPLCNACGIRWNKYGIICNVCNYVPCKQERQYVQCVRCQAVMPEAVRTRRGGGQKVTT